MAPLIILIFALLCKGMLSQEMTEYMLAVPASVSVQQGLCVHIPCRFTYDQRHKTVDRPLRWYWCKRAYFDGARWIEDSVVATNDKELTLASAPQNRFQLSGDVKRGDCSFTINNAQYSDRGQFYFRIDGGGNLKYSYRSNTYRTHPLLEVSVTALTEKPIILNSSQVVSGKAATFTCWAPGACSGTKPTIFWTLGTGRWTQGSPLSKPFSNGSWMHGSNFTFMPSQNDQGKSLTCSVQYPPGASYTENSIRLDVAYPPLAVKITVTVTRPGRPDLSPEKGKESLDLQEVQEGDTVHLLCQTGGKPAPSLRWTKGDKTLNNTNEGSLLLSQVRPEDAGRYQCQAENSHGSANDTVSVNVQYAPRLSGNPQTTTACQREDNGLFCTCSLHSWPPPQIQWHVAEQTVTGNTTRGDLHVTSVAQGTQVSSSLRWKGNVDRNQVILCHGNNSAGVYRMQFLLSSLETGFGISPLVAGLCGTLVAAVVFSLVLLLFKLYKQRKTSSKAGGLETVEHMNGGHQRPSHSSLIYGNIFPVGQRIQRIPQAAPANVARERSPKTSPISREHTPNTDVSEEVHYASLEFKLRDGGAPIPEQESVEYSVVRPK